MTLSMGAVALKFVGNCSCKQKTTRWEKAQGSKCGYRRQPNGDELVQKGPAGKVESDEQGRGLQESIQTPGSSLLITEQEQHNKIKRRRKRADPRHRDCAGPEEGMGGVGAPPAVEKLREEGSWTESLRVF